MKKIYSILLTAAVALAAFAACTRDYVAGPMARNLTVGATAEQIAADGNSFTAEVTADGAWVANAPEWISVEPAYGQGNETVKITVAPNDGAERSGKVGFYSAVGAVGSTDITLEAEPLVELTVTQAAGQGQGDETPTISIADYLALGENTGEYLITGAITRIVNTTYGNFDLTDETGTVYVYGLLNEKLEDKVCFKAKELAMGDVLTVKVNNLQLYNGSTWEIVNAVYVSHSKSLIALEEDSVTLPKEGQDFSVKAEVKGADVKVDYDADWISYKGAEKDGENVTLNFSATENAGMGRVAVMSISTTTAKGESSEVEFTVNQEGNIATVSVADFLAAEESDSAVYELVGTIGGRINTTFGNFDLTDASGTVYVYGLTATELGYGANNDKSFASLGLKDGDLIKIRGYRSSHEGKPQVKSAWFIEKLADGPKAVTVAEFLAAEESETQVYILEGTIGGKIDGTYGNFDLSDETGTVFVYGLTATELGYGAKNDKSYASLGLKAGDKIKMKGYRSSHNGKTQVKSGWFLEKFEPVIPDDGTVTVTDAKLPTAYPAEETVITEGAYDFYILNVANFGNGVQFKKNGSYVANKTAMPSEIKTITLTCHPAKSYYQDNLTVYAGTAEKPEGTALTGTLDESGKVETFAVPAGCTYFRIYNGSGYAVYLESIKVTL